MANNDVVPELSEAEFGDFVREGAVLIDFYAEWCMPCLMMSPIVDELSGKFEGKVKFGKVNVSENQVLAQKFNVNSIPSFIFMKDGAVVNHVVGAISPDDFEEKLKRLL